jgi:hypothetical protein
MNSDALIMLILLVFGVAILTALVIGSFLYLCKVRGMLQVVREGVVMAEDGIEYAGFMRLYKLHASYHEVKSVKLLPYHVAYFSYITFRYGPCRWLCNRLFSDVVLIELSNSKLCKYILFTPADCAGFMEKIRQKGVTR